MRWLKSKWVMIGVFVVLAIAALVGVIVGVTMHDEPGLQEDAPGWVRLTPGDFPLTVEAYEYVPSGSVRVYEEGATAEAMSRFNQRAGFDVFTWAERGVDGDVEITFNAPVDVGGLPDGEFGVVEPGGNSQWRRTPGLRLGKTCFIRTTWAGGTGDLSVLVAYHELGHCILLAHDCYRQSIMCGGDCCMLAPTPDGTIPPWLSDFDRDLVRELYAPR